MFIKPRIILLSPYLPTGDAGACSRKIYDCLKVLTKNNYKIHLFSFCSQRDKPKANSLKQFCTSFYLEYLPTYTRYPLSCPHLSLRIKNICRERSVDILQCENSYLTRYLPSRLDIPFILVEHEVLSESFAERARYESNFLEKQIVSLRSIKKRAEERRWYKRFKKIVVFSKHDEKIIEDNYKIKATEVIPLGIDLDGYNTFLLQEKNYDLLFVGSFSHMANVDGINYFYRHIHQLIKKEFQSFKVVFCGVKPPQEILQLASLDKSIVVTGYVDDVREYYAKSKVAIAPIRYGTGMRYKILEAMAAGMPVVTTSVGARGIESKNICIADTPEEFADAVMHLLKNPQERSEIAEKARSDVEQYSWDSLMPRYEAVYRTLMEKDG